jgi:hypothetical protein
MSRRYGRQLTNREIAQAVRDRTPPLRAGATRPTQHARHATADTISPERTVTEKIVGQAA